MIQSPKVKKLTLTALMAAVIFVVTFLIRIPMFNTAGGYINIGDAAVYIASSLLGGPYGMVAAAIGSALVDLAVFPAFTLPTAIVKGLMGLVCGKLMTHEGFRRFIVASVIGGAIMAGGYTLFGIPMLGLNTALAALPFNLIQWAAGVAVASAFYPAVTRIKKNLF